MNMMKNLVVLAVASTFSLGALAADLQIAANKNGDSQPYVSDANFVIEDFLVKVSANVSLDATDDADSVGVSTASNKGSNVYGGSSDGGAIGVCDADVDAPEAMTATSSLSCAGGAVGS